MKSHLHIVRVSCVGCLGLVLGLVAAARAQETPAADAPKPDAAPAGESNTNRFTVVTAQADLWIGIDTASPDEALRSQLALPAGQGLVVTSVAENSPAAEAGILVHDVVLSVADQPVADADGLKNQLRATGEKPVTVRLLRGGKKLAIEVTPKPQTWEVAFTSDAPIAVEASRFWLGVGLATADDTLRSQIGVAAGEGLVVTSVEMNSPAWQAGVQIHDVLLGLDRKPLSSVEGLQTQLQEIGAKAVALKLLRSGKPLSLEVTPEKHQDLALTTINIVPADDLTYHMELLSPGVIAAEGATWTKLQDAGVLVWSQPAPQDALQKQVADLMAQLQQMQKSLEALDAAVKAQAKPAGTEQPAAPSP